MKRFLLTFLIFCFVFLLTGLFSGAEKQTKTRIDSITAVDKAVISMFNIDMPAPADVALESGIFLNKGSPGFYLYRGKGDVDNEHYYARSPAGSG
jgi:hypothetical protein